MLLNKKNNMFYLTDKMDRENIRDHMEYLSSFVTKDINRFEANKEMIADKLLKVIRSGNKEKKDIENLIILFTGYELDYRIHQKNEFQAIYNDKHFLNMIIENLEFLTAPDPSNKQTYIYLDDLIHRTLSVNLLNILNEFAEQEGIEPFKIHKAFYDEGYINFSHPLLDRLNAKLCFDANTNGTELGLIYEISVELPSFSAEFSSYLTNLKVSKETLITNIIPTMSIIIEELIQSFNNIRNENRNIVNSNQEVKYPTFNYHMNKSLDTDMDTVAILYTALQIDETNNHQIYDKIKNNIFHSLRHLIADMDKLAEPYAKYYDAINDLTGNLPTADKDVFVYYEDLDDFLDNIRHINKEFSNLTNAYIYDCFDDAVSKLPEKENAENDEIVISGTTQPKNFYQRIVDLFKK